MTKDLCGNFGLFDVDIFFSEDELNKLKELIKKRNSIAHGDETTITLDLIQKYIVLVTKLMDNWILFIDDFLENEKYLKDIN